MSVNKSLKVPGQAANQVGQDRHQSIFGKRPHPVPEGKGANAHFPVGGTGAEGAEAGRHPSTTKGVEAEEQHGVGKMP